MPGNELFGIDIAGIVADSLGGGLPDVTITRETPGARDSSNLTGGPSRGKPLTFGCKGFWEDFNGTPPAGIQLEANDRKAILIGNTIPAGGAPLRNDAITVHEEVGDSTLYVVQLLKRDPAAATFTYLCRDRRGPDGK
ncbi:MAG: hypothetical protein ACJ8DZ_14100 [Allosphingosinicella sp.]